MQHESDVRKYFSEERRRIIIDRLNKQGKVEVNELSELLNTSEVTIRGDLKKLETEGKLTRTHGGAVINSQKTFDYIFPEVVTNLARKQAIANYALSLINDGDTIVLDTGSTTNEIARLLGAKENLTVVLYDIHIAELLERTCEAHIVLLGGSLRRGLHSTVGPIATKTLSGLRVDKAFITTGAIDQDGFSTADMFEAEIKAAAMRCAQQVIVLADSGKFDRSVFNRFADFESADMLLTDSDISDETYEKYSGLGLKIVRAGKENA